VVFGPALDGHLQFPYQIIAILRWWWCRYCCYCVAAVVFNVVSRAFDSLAFSGCSDGVVAVRLDPVEDMNMGDDPKLQQVVCTIEQLEKKLQNNPGV
jgi:hypothetical protein